MAGFNYTEYLRNNPLLKNSPTGKLLSENLNLNESYQEKLGSILSDYGSDSEIQMYIDSLNNDPNPEFYKDYGDEDFVEDFRNYIADKSLGESKPSSKMKISELKSKIRENIISTLAEQSEDWDEDYEKVSREIEYGIKPEGDLESELMADLEENLEEKEDKKTPEEDFAEEEEDIEADTETPELEPNTPAGLSTQEQQIQDSLKIAYDNAMAIGDEKLANQIGNSITFFTRSHIVER